MILTSEHIFILKAWLLISERFPYCKYCPEQRNDKEQLFRHIISNHKADIEKDDWYKDPFKKTDKEVFRLGQIESICYKDCKCKCHDKVFRKFLRDEMKLLNCKVCGHVLDDYLQNRDCHHKEKKNE